MPFSIGFSDVIAIVALCVAGYSAKKTNDFNKKQQEFIETNNHLNKLLLRKATKEAVSDHQADISANFIKVGKSRTLKIFNKGKCTGRNVRISFPNGNGLLSSSEIETKFPADIEPQSNIELLASMSLDAPRKITIHILWDDETAVDNSKIISPSV
jgi:hypothetical protein